MKIVLFIVAVGFLFRGLDYLGLTLTPGVESEHKTLPLFLGLGSLGIGSLIIYLAMNV